MCARVVDVGRRRAILRCADAIESKVVAAEFVGTRRHRDA
jgi:hypothetical protein